jgi:hypothetical protein
MELPIVRLNNFPCSTQLIAESEKKPEGIYFVVGGSMLQLVEAVINKKKSPKSGTSKYR